jgi:hypothetical protein
VSVSRETLQEHKAILDCKAKGESKGSKCTLPKVQGGQAQQEVARMIGDGAPLKMNIEGKSEC